MQKIPGGERTTLIMSGELVAKLEKIEKRHSLTRAEAIRRMLDLGIDVYEDFETLGIPQLTERISKIKKLVRKSRVPTLV